MAVIALWATAAMAGLNDDLIKAATSGNLPEVKSLIAKGAEVNAKTDKGETALIGASSNGHREIVEALLAKGAEVNAKRTDGLTALMAASFDGHYKIVLALLARGAEVNAKTSKGGTALIIASEKGHREVVQALLAKGAEVNAKGDNGTTALMGASAHGHREIVQALLANGAEVNAKTVKGGTALIFASQKGHREIKDLLIKAGASGADPVKMSDVLAAVNSWFPLIDRRRYAESWQKAAEFFKTTVSEKQWVQTLHAVRSPLGNSISRTMMSSTYKTSLPNAPDGQYVVIQLNSSFQNQKSVIETIIPMMDKDGKWRVAGYFVSGR